MDRKKINEDFIEEKFFDDDDAPDLVNVQVQDYVDPLDLYMQEVVQQLRQDLSSRPQQKQIEQFENDDPVESQYMAIKKNLIIKHKQDANVDNIDPDEFEFLDSDGDLDLEDMKKKKRIEPLAGQDHSKIKYEDFHKNFYQEHEDITNLTTLQVEKIKKDLQIKVKGKLPCRPIISFGHLGFDDTLMNKIIHQKYIKPTAIQCQALPCLIQGRDVIGVAKTGSGKTVAYVWPMIIHVLDQREVERKEGPIAIVILPTRELGQQVYLETKKYASIYGIKVCAILGGENKRYQWKDLINGMDVIIATPGRLIEMLKKKATNLRRCTYLVLDEADNMFTLGFEYQIRSIIDNIRPDRQTMLFTATMKKKVQQLCVDILEDPIVINIGDGDKAVNEDIKQVAILVDDDESKLKWLQHNLNSCLQKGKVLIFVNQIVHCEWLAQELRNKMNIDSLTLHGDKQQYDRTMIINAFKGVKPLLVATDIASRGLDIKEIRTIINFHPPKDADVYIHRIGRTGRAGNTEGVAYTMVKKDDWKLAILLIKNLEMVGQVITPELEQVAMIDDKFKMDRTKKRMGLEYAKGKDASKMLKQALKRQRNTNCKSGLGYQETDEEKKEVAILRQQQLKNQTFTGEVPYKRIQMQPFQGHVPDPSLPSQFEGKWASLNPLQHDYTAYANSVGIVDASAMTRDDVVQHYQLTMRNTFRSSFVSGGEFKSKQSGPRVSYAKKDVNKEQEVAKESDDKMDY